MLQFVSAGISLAQGIMGSSSAKKAAKRKAQQIRAMANYNARVKEMEAKSVANVMKEETRRQAKSIYATKETQKVAQSKDLSKAPMSVMIEQAMEMDLNLNTQRRNRLLQEQNLQQQAKGIRYEGEIGAETALAEGRAKARSSLLGGISGAIGGIGAGMSGIDAAKAQGTYTGSWWKY